jgi:cytochrome oxidase Cu insertion factor (SCO1/SenC/PrrC family)
MKSFLRFLVLAIVGFLLGGELALMQNRAHHPVAAVVSKTTATPASSPTPMAGVQVGGAFSLTDHTGKPVTEKSWPGKYKLVFFGYTHCPDTCPATLQKMTAIMQSVDPKGEKLAPLFVTVDPARDTAAVMAKYVANFDPHITGLTGTEAQIKGIEEAYKVYAAKQPGQSDADHAEYVEDHSAYIYLMSPDDKLLQTFAFDEPAEGMVGKIKESVK